MPSSTDIQPEEAILLYQYGFVLFEKDSGANVPLSLKRWNRFEFESWVLLSHPQTEIKILQMEESLAILLGDAFASSGHRSVVELVRAFIEDQDWTALDQLSGRFALIELHAHGGKVVHDAFGSRSIFYRSSREICVGSHAALIADLYGDEVSSDALRFRQSPEFKQRGTGYLPGDVTMYDFVVCLLPNHYYDLVARRSVRFWPREPVQPTSLAEFLEACDVYFERFSDFIRARYLPVLGLTGGVDSRALIAGLRHNALNCRLITWSGSRLPEKELPAVLKMVEHLSSEHEFLDVSKKISSERFASLRVIADRNTGYSRGGSALTANMGAISRNREVFVRGYGGEIIRGFYNRHRVVLNEVSSANLSRIYATRRVTEPSEFFQQFVGSAFESFVRRADYLADFYNIDPLDLFYWEQRMGVWGASMLNEMDPAVYSMAGFNSRELFELAFGLPDDVRLGSQLFLQITSRYDEKFGSIGVVS